MQAKVCCQYKISQKAEYMANTFPCDKGNKLPLEEVRVLGFGP